MIIFLHGDDTYRSREKLRELKEKFLREVDPSGTNLTTLDGASVTADDIWGAVAAQSFLVRKRMVVIENLGAPKRDAVRVEVAALLDRIPEDAIVVFWEPGIRTPRAPSRAKRTLTTRDQRSRRIASAQSGTLFTRLLELAASSIPEHSERGGGGSDARTTREQVTVPRSYAQEFSPLTGTALAAWVRERATRLGVTMVPDAVTELTGVIGSDLWRMANEVEKLALAASASGSPTITTALIHEHVVDTPTADLFAFLDAVGAGDQRATFHTLHALETSRVDPHYLLAMLHRQLRLLVQTRDLLDRGTPPARLAAELRVPPFVAAKLSEQARRFDLPRLHTLFTDLLDLDVALKSSRAPWEALVEQFCFAATAK